MTFPWHWVGPETDPLYVAGKMTGTQKCLELGHRAWRQRRGRRPQSPRLKGRLHRRQPRLSLRARRSERHRLLFAAAAAALPAFVAGPAGAHDMQHMTMDAPAPPASTSLYNLEPKWTNQNGATVPLGAFSGKPVVDRARALIDIPQLFVVVNFVGWMFQVKLPLRFFGACRHHPRDSCYRMSCTAG